MRAVVWHHVKMAALKVMLRTLFSWPARPARSSPDQDIAQVLRVIALAAIVAFPCCITALILVFLYPVIPDHALLTASAWLTRVAEGTAVIVWAAILRFWLRDRRRRRRRGD